MNGRSSTVVSDGIKIVGQECPFDCAQGRPLRQLPRLRSGFRQRAQTPAKRLNFDCAQGGPTHQVCGSHPKFRKARNLGWGTLGWWWLRESQKRRTGMAAPRGLRFPLLAKAARNGAPWHPGQSAFGSQNPYPFDKLSAGSVDSSLDYARDFGSGLRRPLSASTSTSSGQADPDGLWFPP